MAHITEQIYKEAGMELVEDEKTGVCQDGAHIWKEENRHFWHAYPLIELQGIGFTINRQRDRDTGNRKKEGCKGRV